MDRTLVIVKPDAMKRRLLGVIINRMEINDFKIRALKMTSDRHLIEEHYAEHREKPFYRDLVESMLAYPVVAMVVSHTNHPDTTVSIMRSFIGPYKNRVVGTIRGDYAISDRENSIHASDSDESAKREIDLWFPEGY